VKIVKLTAKIIHVNYPMQQDWMYNASLVQQKKIGVKNQYVTKMNAHQK